jgi:acyl transferase domain-containing protein/acyl carrier protein
MSNGPEAIAIVGVGARLPGAEDAQQYWRNLRAGREAVAALPDEELLAAGVSPEELADPYYVRNSALVPHLREFDADLFGMTTREGRFSDPQLKLMLEVSHAALEDAGLDIGAMRRDVGVFAGTGLTRYSDLYIHGHLQQHDTTNVVLNNPDYIATYTAYKLDLRGPSMTVLTACSSSLVGVHLACQALALGECDMALAGGANVELPYGHGYRWGPGSVRSRDGHCRPFDIAASGTIFTNGAAAVLLKRLPDALADGDHIRAVIHGTALINDGAKMSFSAPSVDGQRATVVQAMSVAGVRPADIDYVEAHGTATPVGDPIEVSALTKAYRQLSDVELAPGSIGIGSVKSNIGHTVPTAGVAGLIKLALSLEAEQLPPSINFTEPNPRLELEKTPFYVNSELRPWPRTPGRPRYAGISSFGVGGTNAHVVVGEGPVPVRTPTGERPRIVVWSGRSAAAAEAGRNRLADYFATAPDDRFADATATLQQGRTPHRVRGAVVATDRAAAEKALRDGAPLTAGEDPVARNVVFLFPGQGSQHARMAAGLYGGNEVFTAELDRCLAALPDGADLKRRWLGEDDAQLRPTAVAQPLLFAVEYALARALIALGVRPAALLGHSVGELVAAAVAGVLDVEDALRVTAARGQLMQRQPAGTMLAVRADADTLTPLLPAGFSVAVVNGPDQIVVAAPLDHAAGADALRGAGLVVTAIPTSHAFHSESMRGAVAPFAAAFDGVTLREPAIPIYSAATGRPLTAAEATDPRFWARQLVDPVRFDRALDAVLAEGAHLLLEVGPSRALTGVAGRHPAAQDGRAVTVPVLPRADRKRRDDERSLLEALAAVWVHGGQPDWAALRPDEPLRRVPMPGYPYQRQRLWVDPKTGPAAPYSAQVTDAAPGPVAAATVATPAPAGSPFSTLTWTEAPAAGEWIPPADGAVALALVPDDPARALSLVLALQRRGYQVVRLRRGDAYREGETEYQVRPGIRADLDAVCDRLAASGRHPGLLVHGWALDEWEPASTRTADDQFDLSFQALHALMGVKGRPAPTGAPELLVVTDRAVDVSGGEAAHPMKAILAAQLRTIAAETPGRACRLVDLARTAEDDLVDELGRGTDEPVVALRAGRRWLPREQDLRPTGGQARIRRGGVYLITGGLGGLGLAVAKGLAGTGQRPKLVLVGRTGRAEGAAAAAIAEMEALGAQVRTHACDVTDQRALARVLDITAAQFGPVNGVLHLAGLPGAGLLARRDHRDVAEVCRPKIHGTLALAAALADRPPPELFVSFSSRSALAGMVGNGDYAAGNAFLDAYLSAEREQGRLAERVLSIGWPAWHSVGMLGAKLDNGPNSNGSTPTAAASSSDENDREHVLTLSPSRNWQLDEHRVDGRAVLPATGHLDLVLSVFKQLYQVPDGHTVVLEQVTFAQPLAVPKPTEVRVRFVVDNQRYRFTINSREGSAEPWLDHSSGYVSAGPAPEQSRRIVDVTEATALAEQEIPSIAMISTRLFVLGPRWKSITGAWAADDTKVVRLRLPASFASDLDTHPLHPALLDIATSIMRDPERDGLRLPFMYRRLAAYAPLPAEFYSRIRRRKTDEVSIVGDIEMFTPDGRLVAEVQGFTMRRANRTSFVSSTAADRDSAAPARPGPAPAGSTPAAHGAPDATVGIAPDQGVRLLLELLSAHTPAHVLVRPFRDGAPVPLERSGGTAAPVATPATVLAAAGVAIGRPAPAAEQATAAAPTPAPPSTPNGAGDTVEARLRALWTEVLGADSFTDESDFFELGGDSLSAVQLMGRIRDVFGVEFGIATVFDHPSIRELAGTVRAGGAG